MIRGLRRRTLLLGLAAVLAALPLLALAPAARAALPVTDIKHTLQTIAHYSARLVEIAQKYRQIAHQIRQIELELQNLKKLDERHVRDIEPTLDAVERHLSGRLLPSHVYSGVRIAHSESYPGWELPFLEGGWWREEERAARATLKTLRETLWAQHLQHRTVRSHLETVQRIKDQLEEAEGHQQTLEALATLAAYDAEVGLLAQVSAQTSADAATAYYSYEVNRRARLERSYLYALSTFSEAPSRPGTGWGALPTWWPGR